MLIHRFPRAIYPAGTHAIPPVSIPVVLSTVDFLIAIDQLTSLTTNISFNLSLSLDGGVTWNALGGGALDLRKANITRAGGITRNSKGQVITQTGIRCTVPDRLNPNRQLKGSITLSENLNTQVDVSVT